MSNQKLSKANKRAARLARLAPELEEKSTKAQTSGVYDLVIAANGNPVTNAEMAAHTQLLLTLDERWPDWHHISQLWREFQNSKYVTDPFFLALNRIHSGRVRVQAYDREQKEQQRIQAALAIIVEACKEIVTLAEFVGLYEKQTAEFKDKFTLKATLKAAGLSRVRLKEFQDELKRLADQEKARRLAERAAAVEKQRQAQAERALLRHTNEVLDFLKITKSELEYWVSAGKLPVHSKESFRKYGQTLEARLFHQRVLDAALPNIAEWRVARAEQQKLSRSSGAKKAQATKLFNKELHAQLDALPFMVGRYENELQYSLEHQVNVLGVFVRWATTERMLMVLPCSVQDMVDTLIAQRTSRLDSYWKPRATRLEQLIQRWHDVAPEHPAKSSFIQRLKDWIRTGTLLEHHSETIVDYQYREHLALHAEQEAQKALQAEMRLSVYEDYFPRARKLQREWSFCLGPTNSGKTYAALQQLKQAQSGVYLAPLRLLALEVYDQLIAEGYPAELITGEEQILNPEARYVCSTIEMMNSHRVVDVAIVDEVQMYADAGRGAAWTAALVGVPAKRVIAVGSEDARDALKQLIAHVGETVVDEPVFTRTTPLTVSGRTAWEDLRKGDAIVVFSRKTVLNLATQLKDEGWRVAMLYGALTPEVRRREAERFRTGNADILVATDAIGMGLNLPIHRLLFGAMSKFDGYDFRPLNPSEIRQIGGRAGRFGLAEKGVVSTVVTDFRNELFSATEIKSIMESEPDPLMSKFSIMPTIDHLERVAAHLKSDQLFKVLTWFGRSLVLDSPLYEPHYDADWIERAETADWLGKGSSLELRYHVSRAPVSLNEPEVEKFFNLAAKAVFSGQTQEWYFKLASKMDRMSLADAEVRAKILGAYAWFSLHWPELFPMTDAVIKLRKKLTHRLHQLLITYQPHRRTFDEDDY